MKQHKKKEYIMEWNKSDKERVSVVYFDNSIREEVIKNILMMI